MAIGSFLDHECEDIVGFCECLPSLRDETVVPLALVSEGSVGIFLDGIGSSEGSPLIDGSLKSSVWKNDIETLSVQVGDVVKY